MKNSCAAEIVLYLLLLLCIGLCIGLCVGFAIFLPLPQKQAVSHLSLQQLGKYVAESGTLPQRDFFSWSLRGERWIPYEWLHAVLLYFLEDLFSSFPTKGLYLLRGFLVFLGISGLFQLPGLRESNIALAAAIPFYFLLSFSSLSFAPSLWSFAFLPWLVSWALTPSRLNLFKTIVVSACWLHLDLGFFFWPFVLGSLCIGALLDREVSQAITLALTTLATILLSGFHPGGISSFSYPFQTFLSVGEGTQKFFSMQTPNFHEMPQLALGVIALLVAAALRKEAASWKVVTLHLVALSGMLLSARHIVLFALVCAYFIACCLKDYYPNRRDEMPQPVFAIKRLAAMGGLLLLFFGCFFFRPSLPQSSFKLIATEIKSYQQQLASKGKSLRLFNPPKFAAELIKEEVAVFIDERAQFFAVSRELPLASGGILAEEYQMIHSLGKGWEKVFTRWDFNAVIVNVNSPLRGILELKEEWQHRIKTADVFVFDKGRRVNQSLVLFTKSL